MILFFAYHFAEGYLCPFLLVLELILLLCPRENQECTEKGDSHYEFVIY